MARLRAGYNFSVKSSTPEELYCEKTEDSVGKSIEFSRIEHDQELQNMFYDSILSESAVSTTFRIPKFAHLNYESFEEKLPQNPENTQSRTVNDTNCKPGANQWSASMSNQSTSFRGTMLSTIFEESLPTMSQNEKVYQSSAVETTTTKGTVENDSTPSKSLKYFSGKTEVAPRSRSRSHSQKSSTNFDSKILEKSISKRKNRRTKRLPIEQQIRIQEWTIRQLNNIEEASKHELVIEVE
ncbi:uncharacterized protein LOC127583236 [Pristis pectinata]|uniref:uncharacterized protein LOC127583236 n=1 Tax=Pristis pectinata TaxID=685728 RepID=UPI00223DDFC4|nr:uncharacterized protein LOC127583236 [Pristis pectinata]